MLAMHRKKICYAGILAALIVLSVILLRRDAWVFLKWYFFITLLGFLALPAADRVFGGFDDHGWLFSKVIGLLFGGYFVWLMSVIGLVQFTNRRALVETLILAGILWTAALRKQGKTFPDWNTVLFDEILFFGLFLMWTWFVCFNPQAKGTEKYMDYGFLAAMMRSAVLPARDIWYGLKNINYYYGGQYYAAYLAKISYTDASDAYNLMRTMISSFGFVLPFSLIRQMLLSHYGRKTVAGRRLGTGRSFLGGILAGTAVSLAGNMHYVLYGLFGKVFRLPGYADYWFPASTRYIGHNPQTNDQCIHEFPCYSFVLGDLHAHMVNIMFVVTLVAILYSWAARVREQRQERLRREAQEEKEQRKRPKKYVKEPLLRRLLRFVWKNIWEPRLLLAAFFVGLFKWTNYWDFVIYFTVTFFCIIFVAFYRYGESPLQAAGCIILHVLEIFGFATAAALPFTLTFETMVSGVAVCTSHTAFYQLAVLWGLPVTVLIVFTVYLIGSFGKRYRKRRDGNRFTAFCRKMELSDVFIWILGFCGFGLILIPELVYVRDIYENGYARSNTMFKLTYQAFILFGMMMGYVFVRLISENVRKWVRGIVIALLGLFLLTCGYFPYSVSCWFGNVFQTGRFQGIDCTMFLENAYPEDAAAIRWLNLNADGQPVILEVYGDSYSDDCRVSAMTGLPTVEGWYVHEWLWRNNPEDLTAKRQEIDTIYTSQDEQEVKALVRKYGIRYIFVGSCERTHYSNINDSLLESLGSVVFRQGNTYIVEIGQ